MRHARQRLRGRTMSIQVGALTSLAATSAVSGRLQHLPHPFKDLRQALRSGDLDAASSAYAALATAAPQALARKPDGLFAQIGTALAAGDLDGARSAFTTMLRSHLPRAGGQTAVPPQYEPAPSNLTSPGTGLVDLAA